MGRQNRKGRWWIYAVFFVTGRYSNRMEFKGRSGSVRTSFLPAAWNVRKYYGKNRVSVRS